MWHRALLLPLFIFSDIAFSFDGGYKATVESEVLWSEPRTVENWWPHLLSTVSELLPTDSSSRFINDLRLALAPIPHDDQDDFISQNFTKRDLSQQVFTRCRVRSTFQPSDASDGPEATRTLTPNYTPTGSDGQPLPTQTIGDGHGGYGQEIIAVTEPCGDIPVNASVTTQPLTGPNGQLKWLTCGINPSNSSSGWLPPYANIDQIITYQGGLRAAIAADYSPFKPCENYVELFETAGSEFGIPPFFIAAFALQESTCNPDLEGQGGEQGMMQISEDKCGNAPDGNCRDVIYNVRTAVSYFRDVLNSNNGNVFEAVGNYNGWHRGMSFAEATTWGIAHNCCRCQRNLDYLHQFFNGWLQNLNAYDPRLGEFFNTDIC